MDVYRPLRAALLVYELIRFGALVGLPVLMGPSGMEGSFPYLAYMAPNALFLLMALFVWLRPGEYSAYIPLYGAGKIVTVIAFGTWCVFSFEAVVESLFLMRPESVAALGGAFLLSLADVFAFAGGMVLMKRISQALSRANSEANSPAISEASSQASGEQIPAPVESALPEEDTSAEVPQGLQSRGSQI